MNIVSLCFIGYVLIVTGGYYVVPARFRPQWLLASSLFFYLYAGLWCVLYLAFSVISTWACALILDGRKEKAKGLVALTVGLNLAVLAAVKYLPLGFGVLERLLKISLPGLGLLVPLGISYYTLQSIAYLVDVYRGRTQAQKSLWRYSLYMCFFPIIMQGPICRYEQLAPQLYAPHKLDYGKVKAGMQLALWGFFKKLVIADRAALLVN